MKTVRWLLVAAIIIYLVTGLGITEFRAVESLTSGLLNKVMSFRVHANSALLITFLALLALHIFLPLILNRKKRRPARVAARDSD